MPKTILVKKPKRAQTDYYKKLAAQMFNVDYEAVTDEMRTNVKTYELKKMFGFTTSEPVFREKTDLRRYFTPGAL